MSVRVERGVPASASRSREVIVDFDASELKAPFLLRCGALLIDYILIVSVPIICLLIGRLFGDDGRKLLNSELSNTGWLMAILLAVTNFVIFPMFSGQSIGKMLTGLRIVKTDGSTPGFGSFLLRHILGYLLTVLTLGLGFLFSVLNAKGRALHDLVAGTVVVYGKRRPKSIGNGS
jgi:uncharacterized RDD family membrane protein YckC